IVRVLVRRRRLSRLDAGAPLSVTGWCELLDTADDLGLDIADTSTPRVAAVSLGESVALERTLAALEREAFARPSGARGARVADVLAVLRDLRASTPWRARLVASV